MTVFQVIFISSDENIWTSNGTVLNQLV